MLWISFQLFTDCVFLFEYICIADCVLCLDDHRYRYVCFIPWHTPRNEQWGAVKNFTTKEMISFVCHCVLSIYICSNILAASAYGVYISQLIRYTRACGSYQDFMHRELLLTRNLLNQGFLLVKLKSSFRKFYDRQHDLVDRYGISVSQMTTCRKYFPIFSSFMTYHRVCN